MQEYNRRIYEENERRKRFIEEKAKRKGINIEQLDKRIDNCKKARNIGIFGIIGGILLIGGANIIGAFMPQTLPLTLPLQLAIMDAARMSLGLGGVAIAGSSTIVAGVSATVGHVAKKKKDNI